MASTYSTNLAIELIGTGEQSGTWGTTTNTNLGTLLEQAISGYVTQAITDGSGANTTITIPNGTTGVARNIFIEMTGALSFSTTSLIVPANKKLYFIFNNTTGGFAVTVKVSGQTGILVPNGKKVVLVSNGTDIVEAHTAIVGNATMGGTLGVTGATTLSGALTYGGVTLSNAVTGTGNMVLATSPTLTTPNIGAATGSSLNIGSGALTAGATGVTTLSATGNLSTTGASSILQALAGASVQIQNTAATANWNLQTSGTGLSINSPQNGTLSIANNTAVTGTLTAGATGVTTLTASGDIATSQSNASNFYGLQTRNTNAGAAAVNGLTVGNDSSAYGLTLTLNSSAFTAANNYAYLLNQFNAPLILGSNGVGVVTINASGMNGVLGATTPAAASVTTLVAAPTSVYGIDVGGGRTYIGGNGSLFNLGIGYNRTRTAAAQTPFIGATDSATPDLVISNSGGTELGRFLNAGGFSTTALSATGTITGSADNAQFHANTTNASGYSSIYLQLSGVNKGAIFANHTANEMWVTSQGAANPLILGVNTTEVARISSTGLAVTGDVSATQQLLWGGASQGRVSHDGTNAYFDNTVSGATYFRTNGTTIMGVWQASGLDVTGALSATGTATVGKNISAGTLILGDATPSINAASFFRFQASNTARNWEVSVNQLAAGAISFTPNSGAAGGTTYTTPVLDLYTTGASVTGALSATTTVATGGYTVATLPAGTVGMRAYVTDATAPTYNGALTGGGAVTVPVFYNGAAWVSA